MLLKVIQTITCHQNRFLPEQSNFKKQLNHPIWQHWFAPKTNKKKMEQLLECGSGLVLKRQQSTVTCQQCKKTVTATTTDLFQAKAPS